MKFLISGSLILTLCNFCYSFTSENLRVRINDGKILGRYMTSISGKTIRAFMSIPYAAPPVGELRFKAPIKPKPWYNQVLLAQSEPSMCTQTNIFDRDDRSVFGQEDCLYLNVYTPDVCISYHFYLKSRFVSLFSQLQLNLTTTNKKLPVMVWLHGGVSIVCL